MLLCTTVFPGTPACMYLHLHNYKYLYFCQQKYKLQKIYLKVLAQPPFPWLASCFALLELSMCTLYSCMCTIYSTPQNIPVHNIFMCTIYSCAQHIHMHNIFHCTIIFLCTIYSCAQYIVQYMFLDAGNGKIQLVPTSFGKSLYSWDFPVFSHNRK